MYFLTVLKANIARREMMERTWCAVMLSHFDLPNKTFLARDVRAEI
jgi:hypothetical protein